MKEFKTIDLLISEKYMVQQSQTARTWCNVSCSPPGLEKGVLKLCKEFKKSGGNIQKGMKNQFFIVLLYSLKTLSFYQNHSTLFL